jgi:hypothetical protein
MQDGVPSVVKTDVEAGAMLDEMLAAPTRSPFEDLEPTVSTWMQ